MFVRGVRASLVSLRPALRPARPAARPAPSRWFAEAAAAVNVATKVTLTIATPVSTVSQGDVDSVILPGLEGQFEVKPQHLATISELQPGLVVLKTAGESKKFFVSGGFAFVHADSTCSVNVVECHPVENLDADLAKQTLTESQQRLNSAVTEQDKAVARIAVETAEAVLKAIGTK